MIKRAWILLLILFAVVGFSGTAKAELIVIGTATIRGDTSAGDAGMPGRGANTSEYNLIYEDDQGLIWLDYTNPGNRWPQQMGWAAGLNDLGVLTYKFDPGISVSWGGDWRLPETMDGARRFGYDGTTTVGFNITSSELGHLFYLSLGNRGYYDTKGTPGTGWFPDSNWGPKNTGPFENLQAGMYRSGTEYSIYPQHAWAFNFAFGHQGNKSFKSSYPYLGIAVRPGTVSGR
jgi:hypothetical protein